MNQNNNYINNNFFAADPLATLFESSTDSAATPAEQPPAPVTTTAGPPFAPSGRPRSPPQGGHDKELMTQLLDLTASELLQAATNNSTGVLRAMREAHTAYNSPTLYPPPPPSGEQPPPAACAAVIQAWKSQLVKPHDTERTLRHRLGLPQRHESRSGQSKRTRDDDPAGGADTPDPKQRRLPIGGLLNPDEARRPTEGMDNEVTKALAQGDDEDSILAPKEKPLPFTYPSNG